MKRAMTMLVALVGALGVAGTSLAVAQATKGVTSKDTTRMSCTCVARACECVLTGYGPNGERYY